MDDEFSFEDDGSSGNGANVSEIARCITCILVASPFLPFY